MTGVRLRFRDTAPPFFVPGPDELWIAVEGFGSGEVLEPVLLPESAVGAKGRDAAFGGDAGAGQNRDGFGVPDGAACFRL